MQRESHAETSSQKFHWLSVPAGKARKITVRMCLMVLAAYLVRILIHQSLEYERGSFGSLWWVICPVACIVGVGIAALILALAVITVRRAGHIAPAIVLLGGIVLISFLPLPPLPKPVFPEEMFFRDHRSDFEAVIHLAGQDRLDCLSDLGCDVLARKLPPEYIELSNTGFVRVWTSPSETLTVTFWPLDSYYPIVYFDRPEDRNLFWHSSCWDSRWTRKLDEHWYLCVED